MSLPEKATAVNTEALTAQPDNQRQADIEYISLYKARNKIYTRRITGFYQRLRRYTGIPLLLAYFLTPWFSINQRPAILFDLSAQKFHILWITFWPQDGYLLAMLLMLAAFALFTSTVVVGRVWCGFSCPQTVWTMMFIWAEDRCEGNRNQRIKLDQQPWTVNKIIRKLSKHGLWLLISLATGATFIAYFYGIQDLFINMASFTASMEVSFWVALFTALTYINAGWMREQVCKYMCPYARFQSVMYDKDTLLITYDKTRGEKRGPRKTGPGNQAKDLGDCIDCSWCLQVCPVDIDIRDGLQADCIDCGLCADACDDVMDKMGYAKGLIRFTSQTGLALGVNNIWRPRLIGYLIVMLITTVLFSHTIATRIPLGVDVIRDRGLSLYNLVDNEIENTYTVKINHMGQGEHVLLVRLEGELGYRLKGAKRVLVEAGEVFSLPIRILVPKSQLQKINNRLDVIVESEHNVNISARQTTSFIGPRANRAAR